MRASVKQKIQPMLPTGLLSSGIQERFLSGEMTGLDPSLWKSEPQQVLGPLALPPTGSVACRVRTLSTQRGYPQAALLFADSRFLLIALHMALGRFGWNLWLLMVSLSVASADQGKRPAACLSAQPSGAVCVQHPILS